MKLATYCFLYFKDTNNISKKTEVHYLHNMRKLYKTNEKNRQLAILKEQTIEQENIRLKDQQQKRLVLFIFVTVCLLLVMISLFIWQRSRNLAKENAMNNALIAEKKQFFADISHELRTPLTIFKLKMEELEYDLADDPQQTYQLLNERIDSFNTLINDISLLAQQDKGELELNCNHVLLKPFFQQASDELISLAKTYQLKPTIQLAFDEQQTATF